MEKRINEAGKARGVSSLAKAMSLAAAIVMAVPATGEVPVIGDMIGASEAHAGSHCYKTKGYRGRIVYRCKRAVGERAKRRERRRRVSGTFTPRTGSCSQLSRQFDRDVIRQRNYIAKMLSVHGKNSKQYKNACADMCTILSDQLYAARNRCHLPEHILAVLREHKNRFCIRGKK